MSVVLLFLWGSRKELVPFSFQLLLAELAFLRLWSHHSNLCHTAFCSFLYLPLSHNDTCDDKVNFGEWIKIWVQKSKRGTFIIFRLVIFFPQLSGSIHFHLEDSVIKQRWSYTKQRFCLTNNTSQNLAISVIFTVIDLWNKK